jgi:hypothetical protein
MSLNESKKLLKEIIFSRIEIQLNLSLLRINKILKK